MVVDELGLIVEPMDEDDLIFAVLNWDCDFKDILVVVRGRELFENLIWVWRFVEHMLLRG